METTAAQPDPVIFVADDDPDDINLLRLLLRKAGLAHPLNVYHEGEALLAALSRLVHDSLQAIRPLLCFLDVKMPGMTGHEVLRRIRDEPALNQMPVVMLSSSAHPGDIKQAMENGAQCYLTKYPQPAVLKETVAEALRFAAGPPAGECFRIASNHLLAARRT